MIEMILTHIIGPVFLIALFTFAGAITYRMRGGKPDIPRPIEHCLFCFPAFLTPLFLHMSGSDSLEWSTAFWCWLAYVVSVVAVLTGHGLYFLAMLARPQAPERMDFVLWPFFGKDPRCNPIYRGWWDYNPAKASQLQKNQYAHICKVLLPADIAAYGKTKLFWRCMAGFAVTGGIVTIPPALAILFLTPYSLIALGVAIAGLIGKPLAYYISEKLGHGTEGGEYGFGGIVWFACVTPVIFTL